MPAALIGPAIGAVGGLFSKNASDGAMSAASNQAAFNPFNISGAGGNVTFDNGQANVTGDAQSQMFQQGFGNLFSQLSSGQGGNQGMIDFGNQIGNNMGGFFNQANAMSDPTSAMNAAGMFNQFANQNAQFGQQQGMNQMNLANMFGQQQGGRNEGMAQNMFGAGQQMLGNTDFSQLSADNLAATRAAARPAEERAVNSKFQNLFSRGQLGTTGGAQQLGALSQAQEQADLQRVLGSQQMGMNLQNQQFGMGMGMMGQGQSFRGQDDQFNAQRAQMFGNMGQNMMGFGQGAGQQGMNAAFMGNELMNNRGQQRMANAGQMFGFGQGAQQQNFNQMVGSMGANSQMNADMRNLIALGGNLGSAGASAGANQAQYTAATGGSPMGGMLSTLGSTPGIGSAVMSGISGLFSDMRLKDNIEEVGTRDGIKWYTWSWNSTAKALGIDSPTYGVMAQELLQHKPEAVTVDEATGYLKVDYSQIVGA